MDGPERIEAENLKFKNWEFTKRKIYKLLQNKDFWFYT